MIINTFRYELIEGGIRQHGVYWKSLNNRDKKHKNRSSPILTKFRYFVADLFGPKNRLIYFGKGIGMLACKWLLSDCLVNEHPAG